LLDFLDCWNEKDTWIQGFLGLGRTTLPRISESLTVLEFLKSQNPGGCFRYQESDASWQSR